MRTTRESILPILLTALAVHAAVVAITYFRHERVDAYAFQSLDAREFYDIAQNLARHGVFSADANPPLSPDTWRTPGYPMLLVPFVWLTGGSPSALVLIQQLFAVLNATLLFVIARRWMSKRRAWIIALLFLIEPYGVYYSLWLMSATCFVTVLLLLWLVWLTALNSRHWAWFACAGALTGFLVLIRPVATLVPIALVAGLLYAIARSKTEARDAGKRRLKWTAVAALIATCLMVVGSWMTRNRIVAGHFSLADQGGVVLAYFKAAEVELWKQDRSADRYLETTLDFTRRDQPHLVWDDIDRRLQEKLFHLAEDVRKTLIWQNLAQGNRSKADPFVVSRALSEIAMADLSAAPLSTLAYCAIRSASLLTFPMNLALKPPKGVPTHRMKALLMGVPYTLLLIAVFVRLVRRRMTFELFFFPLVCTLGLLAATAPQLDPRFRLPMIPLLLVLAALPAPRQSATAQRPSHS